MSSPIAADENPRVDHQADGASVPDEVAALRARVDGLEEDLQQLAYVVSHDLPEPLRMITSYLGLLERRYADQLDDTAGEFIAYAVDGARRMGTLLDDLLRYSRAGGLALTRERVDVGEVAEQVLEALRPVLEATGATVQLDAALPVVVADRARLGQLIEQLVANGARFRPPERPNRVTVQMTRTPSDTGWQLDVVDDGIGIDPRHADRIFEIFQRLHTPEEYPGNGIGLALCRRLAEQLGGRVSVVSAPGEGSTFAVTVPDLAAGPA